MLATLIVGMLQWN